MRKKGLLQSFAAFTCEYMNQRGRVMVLILKTEPGQKEDGT